MAQIGLIDYGCGNIRSVAQAFEYLGHQVSICEQAEQARETDYLVLPGVGAFEKASHALKHSGFDMVITDHVRSGKPFLGICVGMQILMDKGLEFGEFDGLGLVSGAAQPLTDINENAQTPHIGWSQVAIKQDSYFSQYDLDGEYFYFNHSYICVLENDSVISAQTQFPNPWTVMVEKDNMIGVQCHPEKSHIAGLRFLAAFAEMK